MECRLIWQTKTEENELHVNYVQILLLSSSRVDKQSSKSLRCSARGRSPQCGFIIHMDYPVRGHLYLWSTEHAHHVHALTFVNTVVSCLSCVLRTLARKVTLLNFDHALIR